MCRGVCDGPPSARARALQTRRANDRALTCDVLRSRSVRLVTACCLLLTATSCSGALGRRLSALVPHGQVRQAPFAAADGRKTPVTFRLDNGLEVVLEENHAAPVVAFQAWVK